MVNRKSQWLVNRDSCAGKGSRRRPDLTHQSAWFLALLLVGCNVTAASDSTGGVALDGAPGGKCARALGVVSSDYTSTNVSVLSTKGALLSASIISSASAAAGLTTALSGDVVLPSAAPSSGELVLIDRFPNSVLTWITPSTATVRAQLAVGTGFGSNPQDYLEVSASKAYVTRYETNAAPGKQANDGGGDVLVINPATGDILSRIDMATAGDGAVLPRPSRLARMGEQVWVSLQRATEHFDMSGDGRVVGIDPNTDTIAWTLDLPGVSGCSGLAVAPSGNVVALACASLLASADLATSAVVLLDATKQPPLELKRIAMASLGAPVGSPLAFYSETDLVGVALGTLSPAPRNDTAYTLNTTSGLATPLLESSAPFSFGDVRCAPGCTEQCVLADASAKELKVWNIQAGQLVVTNPFVVDTSVNLPPRSLGAL